LSAVEAAFRDGGSIVAAREDGTTGLGLACEREDWEVAWPIVKLLLAKRFAPSMMNEDGYNALHMAAGFSSAEVAALLLGKMQKMVNIPTKLRSALALCCFRYEEEAVKVARVLLDAGNYSRTPLLVACLNSRPELVSLLLERGANVKAVDKDGDNALISACFNGVFGREIIPLLVNTGVDVAQRQRWS
jgi:ankyrin repeat protein